MEILTDLTRAGGSLSALRNVQDTGTSQIQQHPVESLQSSISPARRDLINALNLMQAASGIIQEALNASSKLRSLAMSSMFTGHTDYNEVADSLAGIQSSLHQYGQTVSIPQIHESSRKQPEPDITFELDVMGEMAKTKSVPQDELSAIEKGLKIKENEMNSHMFSVQTELGLSKPSFQEKSVSVKETSYFIAEHSGKALTAQGNIRPEAVSTLL